MFNIKSKQIFLSNKINRKLSFLSHIFLLSASISLIFTFSKCASKGSKDDDDSELSQIEDGNDNNNEEKLTKEEFKEHLSNKNIIPNEKIDQLYDSFEKTGLLANIDMGNINSAEDLDTYIANKFTNPNKENIFDITEIQKLKDIIPPTFNKLYSKEPILKYNPKTKQKEISGYQDSGLLNYHITAIQKQAEKKNSIVEKISSNMNSVEFKKENIDDIFIKMASICSIIPTDIENNSGTFFSNHPNIKKFEDIKTKQQLEEFIIYSIKKEILPENISEKLSQAIELSKKLPFFNILSQEIGKMTQLNKELKEINDSNILPFGKLLVRDKNETILQFANSLNNLSDDQLNKLEQLSIKLTTLKSEFIEQINFEKQHRQKLKVAYSKIPEFKGIPTGVTNNGNTCYFDSLFQKIAFHPHMFYSFNIEINKASRKQSLQNKISPYFKAPTASGILQSSPKKEKLLMLGKELVSDIRLGNSTGNKIGEFIKQLQQITGSGPLGEFNKFPKTLGRQEDSAEAFDKLAEIFYVPTHISRVSIEDFTGKIREKNPNHHIQLRLTDEKGVAYVNETSISKLLTPSSLVPDDPAITFKNGIMTNKRYPKTAKFNERDMPKYLTISLKRFSVNGKITTPVVTDEILEIKPTWTINSKIPIKYRLVQVVLHLGTSKDGGHYTSFIKVKNKWYYMNDDSPASPYSIDQVLTQIKEKGYIYTYEKI